MKMISCAVCGCRRHLYGKVSGQVVMVKQNRNAADGLLDPQIILVKSKSGVRIDVEVSINAYYGYDIQCEAVGEKGVIRLPDLENIIVKTAGMRFYENYTDWSQRFIHAYDRELKQCVGGVKKFCLTWDGYAACITADTLIKAGKQETIEPVIMEPQPEFYW